MSISTTRFRGVLGIAVLGLLVMSATSLLAAEIRVINNDDPLEGFNDPRPWTPTGGNQATTLGEARLNAFQYAADIWGEILVSDVLILVRANMDEQDCTPFAGILGSAGAVSFHRDFQGALMTETWYPQALANSMRGEDLIPAHPDIAATFNSRLDGDLDCLLGASWYLGYDQSPPAGDIDFVTVLMHEFAHGLGFLTVANMLTGEKYEGFNDSYMINLEQQGALPALYSNMTNSQRKDANKSDPELRWIGDAVTGQVAASPPLGGLSDEYARMYAPTQLQLGSSVSHWSTDLTPSEMMEPLYTFPDHTPGLALFLMEDIGWTLEDDIVPVALPGVLAVVKESAVELHWEFHGDSPLRGFRIYRRDMRDESEHALMDGGLLDARHRSYLDSDAKPGRGYEYSVAAVLLNGDEVRSPSALVKLIAQMNLLSQNQPNPFNPRTEISYNLATGGPVRMVIFDIRGRAVRTLVDENQGAGNHDIWWDGRNADGQMASAGVYFYRLEAESYTETRRMVLVK